MAAKRACEDLDRLKRDVVSVFLEAKTVRLSRDVSFYEDAQMSRDVHERIDALIKHLLIGHSGEPCPAGERPIVSASSEWD